jgi:galactonate dehydratase
MKITDIKAYPVWVGQRNLCLVKIETDEGLYGWGESGVSGRELAVIGAISHFREFLIGKDATRIGAIWQELYRGQYFEGGRILAGAISAIDIALWDIAGKALDVPIHRLLGGKQRDRLECFITTTKPYDETLVEDAKDMVAQGWRVIRTTAGDPGSVNETRELDVWRSMADAASVLTEVRQELGDTITLGIDYHHRLSVAETASFCQRMPSGTIDFIEEPIRNETPVAYEALRKMIDVPFAIGEECASKWDFMPYIEQGITSFARIDVCNVGGISEAIKIAAAAETHYIDVMPHDPLGPICSAATIQFCAAIPNFSWCEVSPYESRNNADCDRFFVNPPDECDCYYAVGDVPGHGVDVNEEEVARQTFRFWETPRMKRPDGSFTNW